MIEDMGYNRPLSIYISHIGKGRRYQDASSELLCIPMQRLAFGKGALRNVFSLLRVASQKAASASLLPEDFCAFLEIFRDLGISDKSKAIAPHGL